MIYPTFFRYLVVPVLAGCIAISLILSYHTFLYWVTVCVCVRILLLVSFNISATLMPFRTQAPHDLTVYQYICYILYDIFSLLCPKN
jgi:hypothetical protein